MLTKPTVKQLQALSVLSRQPYWGEVDKLISQELQATLQRMVDISDERELRQLQGAAKFLTSFQSMVSDAPSMLEKLGTQAPL